MRPALALAAALAATLACSSSDTPSCPGNLVATFHFDATLVPASVVASDPRLAPLDPLPDRLDCTAPIAYPPVLSEATPAKDFDAKLTDDPATSAAALCRSSGMVYSGARTGTSHYEVEADADSAVPCTDSLCTATLRVVMKGDVAVDGDGVPQSFAGLLVEVLTEDRGACDACLPPVPDADPPLRSCAARYALTGTLR